MTWLHLWANVYRLSKRDIHYELLRMQHLYQRLISSVLNSIKDP